MSFLADILTIICTFSYIVLMVSLVAWGISALRRKQNKAFEPKHSWKKITLYSFLIMVISAILLVPVNNRTPDGKKEIAQERKEKREKSERSLAESKKKESSKESSKQAKKELSAEQTKNRKKNFSEYKQALSSIPQKTKYAIVKAYFDEESDSTIVVLSDETLSLSSNELKSVARTAWNSTQDLITSYAPFPEDEASAEMYVTVQDSSGNKIAHTSLLGSFKYDGD